MSTFKGYPEAHVEPGMIEGMFTIKTARRVIAHGMFGSPEDAQRLADCWNACRKLYSPAAHIEETEAYVKRVEQLRKDAVARCEALESTT
jgi:hypothetical protein